MASDLYEKLICKDSLGRRWELRDVRGYAGRTNWTGPQCDLCKKSALVGLIAFLLPNTEGQWHCVSCFLGRKLPVDEKPPFFRFIDRVKEYAVGVEVTGGPDVVSR